MAPRPHVPVVLTHGGAGAPLALRDGCELAARAARAILDRGGDAWRAAIAATIVLEDDARFNAGTGSNLRLDGATIEMDAACMASDGRFGAIGCIRGVKNPILVAERVAATPHLLLVGSGATAFARRQGFPEYDPTTPAARAKYERALAALCRPGRADVAPHWRSVDLEAVWNFPGEPPDCDTVGAVVRDAQGRFAATASTGGTTYMLQGRVGDSPLLGAGLYAGPFGAVAATGVGEEITRRLLCKTVHDWLEQGASAADAAQRAVALFPDGIDVGVLVIGSMDSAAASNREMAWAEGQAS